MADGQRIAAAYAPRRLSKGGIAFDENALADAIEAYAAEERQDGRIAALREVEAAIREDGRNGVPAFYGTNLNRLLAEAESGEQVGEVGDDR